MTKQLIFKVQLLRIRNLKSKNKSAIMRNNLFMIQQNTIKVKYKMTGFCLFDYMVKGPITAKSESRKCVFSQIRSPLFT